MGNNYLYFLIVSFLSFHCILAMATQNGGDTSNFIKMSCKNTLYPTVCIQSLTAYENTIQLSEQQLAQAAISVSLEKAKAASNYIYKVTRIRGLKRVEYQAAIDCYNTMIDCVFQLNRSIPELGQSGRLAAGQDFAWHVSNVMTWVSAALTDENNCLDMFSNPSMDAKVKASLRARVLGASQVTSNALALVNRFAERHS